MIPYSAGRAHVGELRRWVFSGQIKLAAVPNPQEPASATDHSYSVVRISWHEVV